jgi:hypothetical protein
MCPNVVFKTAKGFEYKHKIPQAGNEHVFDLPNCKHFQKTQGACGQPLIKGRPIQKIDNYPVVAADPQSWIS